MYLALLKLFRILLEAVDWVRLHALRYFASPIFQSGSGNVGERAAKLPLSDWRYPITIVIALGEAVVLSVWQVFRWLFFFNTRSIFEFFLSGVKVVIVSCVLSVVGLFAYLSGAPDPAALTHYKTLHQQNTATALLGGDGNIIGVVSNPLLADLDANKGRLYAEMVPPVYWDVLDYKTQRQLDFNYHETRLLDVILLRKLHYKGISLTSFLSLLNPFASPTQNSLTMQLAQNLQLGGNASQNTCPETLTRLCQTVNSIKFAKHSFPYLAQNKGAEFKRWTAIHGNLRGFNDDTAGLRATAEVVFNKKVEQLNNAEQALLAVAQLQNSPLLDNADIASIKEKAVTVGLDLYSKTQPALATNIEQGLAALDLNKRQKTQTFNGQAGLEFTHLFKRRSVSLGRFTDLVESQLSRAYEAPGNLRIISDVQITLPVRDNETFKRGIIARLEKLQRACRNCGLNYQLGKQTRSGGANIEVAVTDSNGQIVRYFKRGETTERATGVLSAIPAAVLLATLGNLPNSRFCNQTYRNLPSSVEQFPQGLVNCQTPNEIGHSLDFQESIQVRASLPLFYALRKQASPAQLEALYKNFELIDLRTKAGKQSHFEQLAYEMSYGMVQSTPLQQLDVIQQLSDVLYGDSQSKAIISISQFLVSDLEEGRRYLEFNKAKSGIVIGGNYLRTQNEKATLRKLMRNDIEGSGGRLKSLANIKNVRFLLTKSGRSYTKEQKLRDHWLVSTLLIRGRRYSVVAFLGSVEGDQKGLAAELTEKRVFEPIMAEIVDSLD